MIDIVKDLAVEEKDTSRSCIFDFPDRPVRPTPPIDPLGGPPDQYPYDPIWDWPPIDPPPVVDPDDPNKGDPPSVVPSTHWLHIFRVTPDLGLYFFHGKPPHEIWMYRQVGLSSGARIGKLVCKRNVAEIDPTDLSGDVITFWDMPRKTDYETYTPVTPDGISSLDPTGQHVMFYWFLFHWTFKDQNAIQNWTLALAGGYNATIPDGSDSQVHPGLTFWAPLFGVPIITGSHGVMVRNTKNTDVGVNGSIS
jgi:hypothetical protein